MCRVLLSRSLNRFLFSPSPPGTSQTWERYVPGVVQSFNYTTSPDKTTYQSKVGLRQWNMNQEGVMLGDRVVNLERQIAMFERMVHMLSNNLDDHFKRYDLIISTQQQQISELNAVLSMLLDDQHRYTEVLREKLSGALHGISSTAASVNDTIHTVTRFNNRSFEPDNIFGEILGHPNNGSGATVDDKANGNPTLGTSVPYDQRYNDGNNDNNGSHNAHSNNSSGSNNKIKHTDDPNSNSRGDERQFGPSIISYEDFSPLNNSQNQPHNSTSATSNPSALGEHSMYPDSNGSAGQVSTVAIPGSERQGDHRHPQGTETNGELDSGITEEQYLTMTGRKRKRSIFMGNFQFLKSPHSVMEVWKEYTEGINGQPSIKDMESMYQTGWRRDPAVNKRYSRRKVLCKAIETGLAKGYSLEYTINLLEEYRYIDREKGLKQPIGWICQGHNIPDLLR